MSKVGLHVSGVEFLGGLNSAGELAVALVLVSAA